ncbi:MAG: DNA methyltransferase [Chloroflexi bacterium]|nr:DNA methyltransferase [Chloroflexota bacterium]MCY4247373.1 DNA methyltransferase [Chloroflexota bacterium]
MNTLFYGDCLTIMREKIPPHSIDLVYLDPPFNSNEDYNAIYKDETGRPLPDQVEAYTDTWVLVTEGLRIIRDLPLLLGEHGINGHGVNFLAALMSGLVNLQPDMAAYLAYMTERLVWIRRAMKPSASIYLHCDDSAAHFLKIVLDVIFGAEHYLNAITWKRTWSHNDPSRFGRITDTIFYYSKSEDYTWHTQYAEYSADYIRKFFRYEDERGQYRLVTLTGANISAGESGEAWRGVNPTSSGRHWSVPRRIVRKLAGEEALSWPIKKRLDLMDEHGYIYWPPKGSVPQFKQYLKEMPGAPVQNLWTDIDRLSPHSKERLGYPTQKPLALLERIIRASSNPGDVVFDPFCGCATTIEAAERLGRQWVGIDITIHAIKRVARARLQDRLHLAQGTDYTIEGVPQNWEGALELWRQDPYQFQKWCVEQVEGFVNVKRSADDGIDGRIYFDMPGEETLQCMALEVKGGTNVGIAAIGYLGSALRYDNVQMAGLIILHELGKQQEKNFKLKLALAGEIEIEGRTYPRMQMLTVREILAGARFAMPSPAGRSDAPYDADLFSHKQPV